MDGFDLFDKTIEQRIGSGEKEAAVSNFIETIQSYRRRYVAKRVVLLTLSNAVPKVVGVPPAGYFPLRDRCAVFPKVA